MIELWDTSALILAARESSIRQELGAALRANAVAVTTPIVLEYLNGARNLAEYDRFRESFAAVAVLHTAESDLARALEVHRLLAAAGPGHQRSVRLVDLLVAATAERHRVPIVHLDRDYERIASITGQPVRWVRAG